MDNIYVLDTSALISNPNVYNNFPKATVIIPVVVLSELDKLKKYSDEVGKNARVCIRNIDAISELGDIDVGVLLENDTLLKVDVRYSNLSEEHKRFGPPDYGDTQILVNAYELNKEFGNVILITNDINLRIKARSFSINADKCQDGNSFNELRSGYMEVANEELGEQLATDQWVDPDLVPNLDINECILFTDNNGSGLSAGRKICKDQIIPICGIKPWGINSKNKEQAFAIDLLLDDDVKLVTITGAAGCGKTIITLASALQMVVEEKQYNRCIIYRPIESVGKELGYLPGTIEEKIHPYFQNIVDNLEQLAGKKRNKDNVGLLKELGRIEFEPLTYIRGRSISNALIICDEAQNLSKADIKTLLTRTSKGTKIILNGDIDQIDNSGLDSSNNGLTYVIDRFKGSDIAGHIHLSQNERSRLAEEAANRL